MQQIHRNSILNRDDTPLWETLVFETTTDRRPILWNIQVHIPIPWILWVTMKNLEVV